MFFNWSSSDIRQISLEKWKPNMYMYKVHVQLNKFLKIALLKNFMLSGMYMYNFYGLNLII